MRRIDILGVTGIVMVLCGALTFLGRSSFVPLWIAWTVGPLLWYLGFAVTLVWAGYRFFAMVSEEQSETTTVIVVKHQSPRGFGMGPVGVIHEIPAMGGFIL